MTLITILLLFIAIGVVFGREAAQGLLGALFLFAFIGAGLVFVALLIGLIGYGIYLYFEEIIALAGLVFIALACIGASQWLKAKLPKLFEPIPIYVVAPLIFLGIVGLYGTFLVIGYFIA